MVPASLAPGSWSVGMMRAIAASTVRRWTPSKNRASASFIVFATIASPGNHWRHWSSFHVLDLEAKYEPADWRATPNFPQRSALSIHDVTVRVAQRLRRGQYLFQHPRLYQARSALQHRRLIGK